MQTKAIVTYFPLIKLIILKKSNTLCYQQCGNIISIFGTQLVSMVHSTLGWVVSLPGNVYQENNPNCRKSMGTKLLTAMIQQWETGSKWYSLILNCVAFKSYVYWGAWMAQSIEHPTLGFGSSHDCRVMESSPMMGSMRNVEPN